MKILGVDPGLATTGWGVLENSGSGASLIDCGYISTASKTPVHERLFKIFSCLDDIIRSLGPSVLAVEELFFSKNAASVFALGQARGVILLLARKKGLEIFEYNPRSVKIALTGYGSADKNQMQNMVKSLLLLEKIPRPDDVADAIAIALCHINTNSLNEKIKAAR